MRKTIVRLLQFGESDSGVGLEAVAQISFANFDAEGTPVDEVSFLTILLESDDIMETIKDKFVIRWQEDYGSEPNEFVWMDESPPVTGG